MLMYCSCCLREDLARPATTLFLHNLIGTLDVAVRATNAQFDEPDTLERLDVKLLEVTTGASPAYCTGSSFTPLEFCLVALMILQRQCSIVHCVNFPPNRTFFNRTSGAIPPRKCRIRHCHYLVCMLTSGLASLSCLLFPY